MMNQEFWSPIIISLQVTGVTSVFAFLLGGFAAYWMKRAHFPEKMGLETIFMLPLVLPPTVVGFGLLVLFGRRSGLGKMIEWLFHQPIVFTWWAAVLAAAVVAFPLVYQTLRSGFESVDKELEDAARTMGANEWQVFRYVTVPMTWKFISSGYMLGFARGIGEFGATLMFAGDIPGRTETIPTAIYLAVDSGNMQQATAWVLCIVMLSFGLLAVVHFLRGK